MRTSEAGRTFIADHEGLSLRAYPDPGSGREPWTIGIGHTSAAGPPRVVPGMTITRERAFAILAADLVRFEAAVGAALAGRPVTQAEFDALVSLAFNIGPARYAGSSLVRRLSAGDRPGAAEAFLAWTKAGGRVLPGLVRRRADERRLFLHGIYQGTGRPEPPRTLAPGHA